MCGAGGRPRRLWLSLSGFMCLLGVGKNELRFLAMPAASELVFIGPVGSSHSHGTRSGRRYQISFTRHSACEHGVMDVHSVVVRTTETMAIHSNTVAYRQRRYLSTKRPHVVISMRGPCLQPAPATWGTTTARCRVAESNCGVWWWR